MQKYYGRVTDSNGNPVAGARITAYLPNIITPLPVIFAENQDGTLASQSNPMVTNASGEYAFVASSDGYEIRGTGSSAVLNISKTVTQFVQRVVEAVEPVRLNRQTFLSSATWTAPEGVEQVTIIAVGGGAGGKRGSLSEGGVGGGAGATVRRVIQVTPLASYLITIGYGGAGGTSGVGTDGGDTTFGSMVTARGGKAIGTGGRGTSLGYGGTVDLEVTANASAPLFYGNGGICAGGDGGIGGVVGGVLQAQNGYSVESFSGGAGGAYHGPAPQTVGGGGGGASTFGVGADGGSNSTGAATGGSGSSASANSGGGGGGGATGVSTPGNGGDGGSGLCIVEWIS